MGKDSLRLLHFADPHLGYRRFHRLTKQGFNQREVDVSMAFKECVDRSLSLKPDLVLCAGDLFHTVRPSNAIITFAFRELSRLASHLAVPIVLIAGNHDTPRRSDSGSLLRLLGEIPGVHISDQGIERFDFPVLDCSVTCLPHAALADPTIPQLRADERRRFNILVAHGQFDNRLVSDFGGVDIPYAKLAPHEWDYAALGHVHSRLDVGVNAAYAGSLEHTATDIWRGAKEPKGFLMVELPKRTRVFHALTSPREVLILEPIDAMHLTAPEVTERMISRFETIAGGIDGKIVRLELLNLPREMLRALDHKAIRSFRNRALNLSIDVRPPRRESDGSATRPGVRRSLSEEIRHFSEVWPQKSARTPAIIEMVGQLLVKVEEQHEARSAHS